MYLFDTRIKACSGQGLNPARYCQAWPKDQSRLENPSLGVVVIGHIGKPVWGRKAHPSGGFCAARARDYSRNPKQHGK